MRADGHDGAMSDLRAGAALRAVRVRRGWRQEDVARRAGISRPVVSRVERGHIEEVGLALSRRVGATLDVRLDVVARWRGGELDRMANARHAALHEAAARALVGRAGWSFVPEVSFNVYGERGVIDLVGWHAEGRTLLVVELKTEIVDVQDLIGSVDRYRRLAPLAVRDRSWVPKRVGAWVFLASGRSNERAIASHRTVLRAAFPADGRRLAGWLDDHAAAVAGLSYLPYVRVENRRRVFATPQRIQGSPKEPIRAGRHRLEAT